MHKELIQEKKSDLIRIMSEGLSILRVKVGFSQDEMVNIIGISKQSFNKARKEEGIIFRRCLSKYVLV